MALLRFAIPQDLGEQPVVDKVEKSLGEEVGKRVTPLLDRQLLRVGHRGVLHPEVNAPK